MASWSYKKLNQSVVVLVVYLVVSIRCSPLQSPKLETSFNGKEMRSMCEGDEPISCLKYKAFSFLDTILKKDFFKLGDDFEVSRNNYHPNEVETSRNDEKSIENTIANYLETHNVNVKVPFIDSTVTLDARNLNNDEIDIKLKSLNGGVEEGRKSKLKKIIIPILTFVLLKAITLVPLALGVLGLKAWNALQLSFFSFVVAVGLAVFQLCKKIASDHQPAQIAAASPWDSSAHFARNLDAQNLAYSAYLQ